MAQLIVRQLEEDLVRELKTRAAQHGRSAEAEHREILRAALAEKPGKRSFKEALLAMPNVGEDADFERRPARPRRVKL
ncbi:MAG TPA: DNA-binding protein [Thermoanaerobaculia bacterium]|nr:DNA-binding protein [Thermoanaerobaculia bacterium]